jgi:hypothetical protein
MDRLNRRRAKQSRSAEVRIKFAMMSSQCKATREWETSTYTRSIGVRANTYNRHINNKMTVRSHEVYSNPVPMTISRSSRPNTADLQPQVPSLYSPRFKHELFNTWTIRSWSWIKYQEHGHRGMRSISKGDVERSPDIDVPDTIDED